MAFLETATALVISAIIGEILNLENSKSQSAREQHERNIRDLINLREIDKQQVISEITNMSEDYANLMSSLGFATRGGTAYSYRERKQQEYLQKRAGLLEKQQELEKQQAALESLI